MRDLQCDLSTSKRGSSSCQCTTTLIGEQKETKKDVNTIHRQHWNEADSQHWMAGSTFWTSQRPGEQTALPFVWRARRESELRVEGGGSMRWRGRRTRLALLLHFQVQVGSYTRCLILASRCRFFSLLECERMSKRWRNRSAQFSSPRSEERLEQDIDDDLKSISRLNRVIRWVDGTTKLRDCIIMSRHEFPGPLHDISSRSFRGKLNRSQTAEQRANSLLIASGIWRSTGTTKLDSSHPWIPWTYLCSHFDTSRSSRWKFHEHLDGNPSKTMHIGLV